MDSQSDADRRRGLMQRDWAAEVTRLMTRVVELQVEARDLGAQNEQLREERAPAGGAAGAAGRGDGTAEGPVQRRERLFASRRAR